LHLLFFGGTEEILRACYLFAFGQFELLLKGRALRISVY